MKRYTPYSRPWTVHPNPRTESKKENKYSDKTPKSKKYLEIIESLKTKESKEPFEFEGQPDLKFKLDTSYIAGEKGDVLAQRWHAITNYFKKMKQGNYAELDKSAAKRWKESLEEVEEGDEDSFLVILESMKEKNLYPNGYIFYVIINFLRNCGPKRKLVFVVIFSILEGNKRIFTSHTLIASLYYCRENGLLAFAQNRICDKKNFSYFTQALYIKAISIFGAQPGYLNFTLMLYEQALLSESTVNSSVHNKMIQNIGSHYSVEAAEKLFELLLSENKADRNTFICIFKVCYHRISPDNENTINLLAKKVYSIYKQKFDYDRDVEKVYQGCVAKGISDHIIEEHNLNKRWQVFVSYLKRMGPNSDDLKAIAVCTSLTKELSQVRDESSLLDALEKAMKAHLCHINPAMLAQLIGKAHIFRKYVLAIEVIFFIATERSLIDSRVVMSMLQYCCSLNLLKSIEKISSSKAASYFKADSYALIITFYGNHLLYLEAHKIYLQSGPDNQNKTEVLKAIYRAAMMSGETEAAQKFDSNTKPRIEAKPSIDIIADQFSETKPKKEAKEQHPLVSKKQAPQEFQKIITFLKKEAKKPGFAFEGQPNLKFKLDTSYFEDEKGDLIAQRWQDLLHYLKRMDLNILNKTQSKEWQKYLEKVTAGDEDSFLAILERMKQKNLYPDSYIFCEMINFLGKCGPKRKPIFAAIFGIIEKNNKVYNNYVLKAALDYCSQNALIPFAQHKICHENNCRDFSYHLYNAAILIFGPQPGFFSFVLELYEQGLVSGAFTDVEDDTCIHNRMMWNIGCHYSIEAAEMLFNLLVSQEKINVYTCLFALKICFHRASPDNKTIVLRLRNKAYAIYNKKYARQNVSFKYDAESQYRVIGEKVDPSGAMEADKLNKKWKVFVAYLKRMGPDSSDSKAIAVCTNLTRELKQAQNESAVLFALEKAMKSGLCSINSNAVDALITQGLQFEKYLEAIEVIFFIAAERSAIDSRVVTNMLKYCCSLNLSRLIEKICHLGLTAHFDVNAFASVIIYYGNNLLFLEAYKVYLKAGPNYQNNKVVLNALHRATMMTGETRAAKIFDPNKSYTENNFPFEFLKYSEFAELQLAHQTEASNIKSKTSTVTPTEDKLPVSDTKETALTAPISDQTQTQSPKKARAWSDIISRQGPIEKKEVKTTYQSIVKNPIPAKYREFIVYLKNRRERLVFEGQPDLKVGFSTLHPEDSKSDLFAPRWQALINYYKSINQDNYQELSKFQSKQLKERLLKADKEEDEDSFLCILEEMKDNNRHPDAHIFCTIIHFLRKSGPKTKPIFAAIFDIVKKNDHVFCSHILMAALIYCRENGLNAFIQNEICHKNNLEYFTHHLYDAAISVLGRQPGCFDYVMELYEQALLSFPSTEEASFHNQILRNIGCHYNIEAAKMLFEILVSVGKANKHTFISIFKVYFHSITPDNKNTIIKLKNEAYVIYQEKLKTKKISYDPEIESLSKDIETRAPYVAKANILNKRWKAFVSYLKRIGPNNNDSKALEVCTTLTQQLNQAQSESSVLNALEKAMRAGLCHINAGMVDALIKKAHLFEKYLEAIEITFFIAAGRSALDSQAVMSMLDYCCSFNLFKLIEKICHRDFSRYFKAGTYALIITFYGNNLLFLEAYKIYLQADPEDRNDKVILKALRRAAVMTGEIEAAQIFDPNKIYTEDDFPFQSLNFSEFNQLQLAHPIQSSNIESKQHTVNQKSEIKIEHPFTPPSVAPNTPSEDEGLSPVDQIKIEILPAVSSAQISNEDKLISLGKPQPFQSIASDLISEAKIERPFTPPIVAPNTPSEDGGLSSAADQIKIEMLPEVSSVQIPNQDSKINSKEEDKLVLLDKPPSSQAVSRNWANIAANQPRRVQSKIKLQEDKLISKSSSPNTWEEFINYLKTIDAEEFHGQPPFIGINTSPQAEDLFAERWRKLIDYWKTNQNDYTKLSKSQSRQWKGIIKNVKNGDEASFLTILENMQANQSYPDSHIFYEIINFLGTCQHKRGPIFAAIFDLVEKDKSVFDNFILMSALRYCKEKGLVAFAQHKICHQDNFQYFTSDLYVFTISLFGVYPGFFDFILELYQRFFVLYPNSENISIHNTIMLNIGSHYSIEAAEKMFYLLMSDENINVYTFIFILKVCFHRASPDHESTILPLINKVYSIYKDEIKQQTIYPNQEVERIYWQTKVRSSQPLIIQANNLRKRWKAFSSYLKTMKSTNGDSKAIEVCTNLTRELTQVQDESAVLDVLEKAMTPDLCYINADMVDAIIRKAHEFETYLPAIEATFFVAAEKLAIDSRVVISMLQYCWSFNLIKLFERICHSTFSQYFKAETYELIISFYAENLLFEEACKIYLQASAEQRKDTRVLKALERAAVMAGKMKATEMFDSAQIQKIVAACSVSELLAIISIETHTQTQLTQPEPVVEIKIEPLPAVSSSPQISNESSKIDSKGEHKLTPLNKQELPQPISAAKTWAKIVAARSLHINPKIKPKEDKSISQNLLPHTLEGFIRYLKEQDYKEFHGQPPLRFKMNALTPKNPKEDLFAQRWQNLVNSWETINQQDYLELDDSESKRWKKNLEAVSDGDEHSFLDILENMQGKHFYPNNFIFCKIIDFLRTCSSIRKPIFAAIFAITKKNEQVFNNFILMSALNYCKKTGLIAFAKNEICHQGNFKYFNYYVYVSAISLFGPYPGFFDLIMELYERSQLSRSDIEDPCIHNLVMLTLGSHYSIETAEKLFQLLLSEKKANVFTFLLILKICFHRAPSDRSVIIPLQKMAYSIYKKKAAKSELSNNAEIELMKENIECKLAETPIRKDDLTERWKSFASYLKTMKPNNDDPQAILVCTDLTRELQQAQNESAVLNALEKSMVAHLRYISADMVDILIRKVYEFKKYVEAIEVAFFIAAERSVIESRVVMSMLQYCCSLNHLKLFERIRFGNFNHYFTAEIYALFIKFYEENLLFKEAADIALKAAADYSQDKDALKVIQAVAVITGKSALNIKDKSSAGISSDRHPLISINNPELSLPVSDTKTWAKVAAHQEKDSEQKNEVKEGQLISQNPLFDTWEGFMVYLKTKKDVTEFYGQPPSKFKMSTLSPQEQREDLFAQRWQNLVDYWKTMNQKDYLELTKSDSKYWKESLAKVINGDEDSFLLILEDMQDNDFYPNNYIFCETIEFLSTSDDKRKPIFAGIFDIAQKNKRLFDNFILKSALNYCKEKGLIAFAHDKICIEANFQYFNTPLYTSAISLFGAYPGYFDFIVELYERCLQWESDPETPSIYNTIMLNIGSHYSIEAGEQLFNLLLSKEKTNAMTFQSVLLMCFHRAVSDPKGIIKPLKNKAYSIYRKKLANKEFFPLPEIETTNEAINKRISVYSLNQNDLNRRWKIFASYLKSIKPNSNDSKEIEVCTNLTRELTQAHDESAVLNALEKAMAASLCHISPSMVDVLIRKLYEFKKYVTAIEVTFFVAAERATIDSRAVMSMLEYCCSFNLFTLIEKIRLSNLRQYLTPDSYELLIKFYGENLLFANAYELYLEVARGYKKVLNALHAAEAMTGTAGSEIESKKTLLPISTTRTRAKTTARKNPPQKQALSTNLISGADDSERKSWLKIVNPPSLTITSKNLACQSWGDEVEDEDGNLPPLPPHWVDTSDDEKLISQSELQESKKTTYPRRTKPPEMLTLSLKPRTTLKVQSPEEDPNKKCWLKLTDPQPPLTESPTKQPQQSKVPLAKNRTNIWKSGEKQVALPTTYPKPPTNESQLR